MGAQPAADPSVVPWASRHLWEAAWKQHPQNARPPVGTACCGLSSGALHLGTPDFGNATEIIPFPGRPADNRRGETCSRKGCLNKNPLLLIFCIAPEAVVALPAIHLNLAASNWR